MNVGYYLSLFASAIAGILVSNFFMRIAYTYKFNLAKRLKEENRIPTIKEIIAEALVSLPHSFVVEMFLAGLFLLLVPLPQPFNDFIVAFFLGALVPDIPYAKKIIKKNISYLSLLVEGTKLLPFAIIQEVFSSSVPITGKEGTDIKEIAKEKAEEIVEEILKLGKEKGKEEKGHEKNRQTQDIAKLKVS